MSRRKKFIKNLNTEDLTLLKDGKKHGKSAAFRDRCHAILLSHKGYEVKQIAEVLDVTIGSVYNWFRAWHKGGFEALQTKPGQGRKPTLCIDNEQHVDAIKKAVKKRAETGTKIIETIEKELDMEGQISVHILRPFLKKLVSYGNAFEGA